MRKIKTLIMLVLPVLLLSCGGNQKQQIAENVMELTKGIYGEADGQQVYSYTIRNSNNMTVELITYGGIVTHLWVPDADGKLADVVAGYDSLAEYVADTNYFGALVGRCANRIAQGNFTLEGKMHQLTRNTGSTHLHGGIEGFNKKVWQAEDFIFADSAGVVLTLTSPDGDEGYPGNLQVQVTYTLTNHNELKIDYAATTDALRQAINEMRVAIEALASDEQDFRTVFGNFRFRWDQRLRDAGVHTEWHVDVPDTVLAVPPHDALQLLMSERLEFGTAGLRGLVGAGPGRLNRATVIRATQGLCVWLRAQVPDAARRGVCIGFDARPSSRALAHDVAAVVTGAGLLTWAGLAVLDQRAAAGVVLTASHNPPEYNGYKVFWGDGAQIIPPHDVGIAAAIDAASPAVDIARMDEGQARAAGQWLTLGDDVRERYEQGVLRSLPHATGPRTLGIAYTPLHGVGLATVRSVLKRAGFEDFHVVASQAEPDGTFPTVRFPNPEESGALDALIALAKQVGADLGLANDPDVDRLAVVAPNAQGDFELLSGNEIGCLLAEYLLTEGDATAPRVVINTAWLGAQITQHFGVTFSLLLIVKKI